MRFKFPTTQLLPQLNGNREWEAGYVSPQDGTQAVGDDEGNLADRHGMTHFIAGLSSCRAAQIIRRKHKEYFGA